MSFKTLGFRALLHAVALVGGRDSATLTGATTLAGTAGRVQSLDPGGATRTVDLPGAEEGINDTDGHWFLIQNTADAAGENLTIRDPANATVGTLTKGQTGIFWGTGGQSYVQVGAMSGPLGSTSSGEGASLVGVQDAGAYFTGASVEAVLAELGALADQLLIATVTVPDVSGGGTDAALTLSTKRAFDNTTDPASARRLLLMVVDSQNGPINFATVNTTTTFSTATTGSIVDTDQGWALIETDAAGDFACTLANSADETVWIRAVTAPANGDPTKRCVVVASNSDEATWSV